ncbi:glycosyl transferase family 1 [Novosphingobium sediminis]|uniref:Glycosyl transferase family 1 n=1 Tax=Novosphingobium sediminis TaxID=707214 RepID=A0A512AH92_9SPHN|nr:glycosyl transferase family 1 [Novosphingobium sediminis]
MAWKLARRGLDWRFRGLRLLIVCLVLGTAALSAIGTLTGGIGRELAARGQSMLGGDLELTLAGRSAAPDELAAMGALGTVSKGVRLQAMARRAESADDAVPVELKAVDARWPLYGSFTVVGGRKAGAPRGMTAWIDPGVGDRLGVNPGDHLRIGQAELVIGGVIAGEPDRLSEGFALGPTVIVSEEALAASGLVQVGSMARWKYRLRTAKEADPAVLADAFKARFAASGFQVKTRDKASPGLDRFVERMGQFLVLVALAALGIAGIGIAGGVSSYLEMRRASIATLKILGASAGDVVRIYLLQIAAAALAAIALGLLLGVGITPLLAQALNGLLPIPPGFTVDAGALAVAGAYGLLIALTFAAPPLLEARRVPAMALLRARVAPVGRGWRQSLFRPPLWMLPVGLGLAGIAGLAVLTSPQPMLAAGFLGGAAAVFAVLALIGRGLAWGAARLPRPSRPLLRMALGNLHRPGAQTSALVVALGFALAAFVLLAAVQTSIDANIAKRVPERAPDYFVLDVPRGTGAETFKALVARTAPRAAVRMVPSMRGAVLAYGPDGAMTEVATLKSIPEDAWLLRGDRGLTYAEDIPEGNVLTAGHWWPKGYAGEPLVSVDEDQAKAIGLKLGDKLRISLLGTEREARVASIRRIDWSSFGFNYALVFSPNALEDAPHTFAATITLGGNGGAAPEKRAAVRRAILSGLVKALPESSVIEVGPVLGQARTLLGQVGTAIFAAASVAVLAGLAVLAGAIAAARAARQYDSVILRVLGASRGQLLALLAAEYALLSAVLAAVALALGGGTAWLVVVKLFEFDWSPDWTRVLGVLGGGVLLVLVLAVAGSLSVLRTRPAQALRAL